MSLYPLFLDLRHKDVLVTGAGEVGQRKATSLAEASPRSITIVDPAPPAAALSRLMDALPGLIAYHARGFQPEDISGKALVFAATPLREVNALVAALCREAGVLCNIADAPEESDFFVPAHFRNGDITVAVSTGGSPALARRIRAELEAWMGNRYAALAQLLRKLRPLVLESGLPTAENTRLFRALVSSPLAERLAANDSTAVSALLTELLPPALHARMGELLHDL